MPDAAREILVAGAAALAHAGGLAPTLQILTDVLAREAGAASAVIVVARGHPDRLEIATSFGLGEAARAGLAAAIDDPGHPIARTVSTATSTFDVLPTAPGGPALRSHLPLSVTRGGTDEVLGVLALAHDRPIKPSVRPLLQAGADLAAAAIDRHRPT